jgi:hypothetical protein
MDVSVGPMDLSFVLVYVLLLPSQITVVALCHCSVSICAIFGVC